MVATGLILSTVVLLLAAVGLCSSVGNVNDPSTLHVISHTDLKVEATFFDNNAELGIALISTKGNLLVTTMNGEVLVKLEDAMHEDGEDLDRLIEIKGQFFLDHRRESERIGYKITAEEAEKLKEAAVMVKDTLHRVSPSKAPLQSSERVLSLISQVLEQAATKPETVHREALRTAVTNLLEDPHTPLIINAVFAMGENEGITGYENPPVMRFYNLARVLATLSDNRSLLDAAPKININPIAFCDSPKPCFNTCPPCQTTECIGLCGRDCTCWPLVCGDCCWHRGCCIHDQCCAKFGFYSPTCLLPTHLTCQTYSC